MGILKLVAGIGMVAAGIALAPFTAGTSTLFLTTMTSMLLGAGAGMTMQGIGSLIAGNHATGFATATRNPIAPWNVCVGRCRVGGTLIYRQPWGTNNQMLDLVFVLAAHEIEALDRVLFEQQPVTFDATQVPYPGGGGPGYPEPTLGGSSYTPVATNKPLNSGGGGSITRVGNVVTVVCPFNIPYLDAGCMIQMHDVPGDPTLNGTFEVDQVVSFHAGSPGDITFTFLSGGPPSVVTAAGWVRTLFPDYKKNVYYEVMLGKQTLGQTFNGMTAGTPFQFGALVSPEIPGKAGNSPGQSSGVPNPWTVDCSAVGKALVFLRLQWDPKLFPSGEPEISFLLRGKNDIWDPRAGAYGVSAAHRYTENAALIIADFLHHPVWGFRAEYAAPMVPNSISPPGDVPFNSINIAALDDAADACDAAVTLASGGSEPAYACCGTFLLTQLPGEILKSLLTSCAGRLSYVDGQYSIFPGKWYGASAPVIDLEAIAAGPVRWKPTVPIRDLYNGVKGTYISPANHWQSSDFPYYAQDLQHGYSGPSPFQGDINVEQDNGRRRWFDIHLPFTISPSMAQRIGKIELLRRRNQGTGTFPLTMAGYQFVPYDILQAVFPKLGWTTGAPRLLEVSAVRILATPTANGKAIALSIEIDVQDASSTTYDWATFEELSPQGYVQQTLPLPTAKETVPLPWSPGYVAPLDGDALSPEGANGPGTFGLQVEYGADAQGNAVAQLQIKGTPPLTDLDDEIGSPYVTATASATGGHLPGGTYVIGVAGSNGSGKYAYYNDLCTIEVPAGSTGSIAVGIHWASGDDGGDLYMGKQTVSDVQLATLTNATQQIAQNVLHYQQTLSPGTASAAISTFNAATGGGPDTVHHHLGVIWRKIFHTGPWAQQVQAVTSTTVTIAGPSMTTNQWAGYRLQLLAKYDPTVEVPVLSMPIASSTASSGSPAEFVLTIGPNAAGVQLPNLTTLLAVGDLVTVLGNYTFTADSFTDANVANGFYPTGADPTLPDATIEKGHLAMVMTGADAGDVQTIAGVTAVSGKYIQFDLEGAWQVTPASGDVVYICAPELAPEAKTGQTSLPTTANGGRIVATPQLANLLGQAWLISVRSEDKDGNHCPDFLAPSRPMYFFGAQGTRGIFQDSTQLPWDSLVEVACTTADITYQLIAMSKVPNQMFTVSKFDATAYLVHIVCAGSDTFADGTTSKTLSAQGDSFTWRVNAA